MKTWVVLAGTDCPWCDKAIDILKQRGHIPKVIKVKKDSKLGEFVQAIGLRTVPQIWHHGVHIGDCDDLEHYLASMND